MFDTILVSSGEPQWQMTSCEHCGGWHSGQCPRVKAVEYWPNGTVKKIEYHDGKSTVDEKARKVD